MSCLLPLQWFPPPPRQAEHQEQGPKDVPSFALSAPPHLPDPGILPLAGTIASLESNPGWGEAGLVMRGDL